MDEIEEQFEDTGTIADAIEDVLAAGGEAATAYRRETWVAETIALVRETRRRAGMTQDDLAQSIGTRQPAIARAERADDMKLSRLWDYLHACGVIPAPLNVLPSSLFKAYVPVRRPLTRLVTGNQWPPTNVANDNTPLSNSVAHCDSASTPASQVFTEKPSVATKYLGIGGEALRGSIPERTSDSTVPSQTLVAA